MTTTRTRLGYPVKEGQFSASRALRVGDRVIVGSTAPSWPDGSWNRDPEAQARRCLELILEALKELGASQEDVVRTWIWQRHPGLTEPIARAHRAVFGSVRPAVSQIVANAFQDPRAQLEIEAEAIIGAARQRVELSAEWLPKDSIGTNLKVGDRVILSCVQPIEPDGSYKSDAEAQGQRCFDLIGQTLKEAGGKLTDIVNTKLWFTDAADVWPTGLNLQGRAFGSAPKPCWSTGVFGHIRPEWLIEVEADAVIGTERAHIKDPKNPEGNRSRGVRVGNRVLVSSSAPIPAEGGKADWDPVLQARRSWEVISAAMEEAGAGAKDIVRARFYIRHRGDFGAMARFTQDVFGEAKPVIACMVMPGYGGSDQAADWRVKMEAEAVI